MSVIRIEIGGRIVEIDEASAPRVLGRLVWLTRRNVWNPAHFRFMNHFQTWETHARLHDFNLGLRFAELLGGASLPSAASARALKREHDRLQNRLNPGGIQRFFAQFGRWYGRSTRFCKTMVEYNRRMEVGTTRTIRVLEVTRDASFLTLSICAAALTGGGAAAASGAVARGAGTVLVRQAAANFLVSQMEATATRLGRAMGGGATNRGQSTLDSMWQSYVDSMTAAAFSAFLGPLSRPITNYCGTASAAAFRRGAIGQGLAWEAVSDRLTAAAQATVQWFFDTHPENAREPVRRLSGREDEAAVARAVGAHFMNNRTFLRRLDQEVRARAR